MAVDLSSYYQLSSISSQVRLLIIEPATAVEQPLVCQLRVISLDDSPEYEALSWCWGTEAETSTMHVNGQEFACKPTLDQALRHLRKSSTAISMWVDAVCINQSDVEEKASQIPLMGRIYSQAKAVRVWLGEGFEGSQRAIALLDCIQRWRKDTSRLDITGLVVDTHTTEIALEVMNKPWWGRVWIVQEAALANAVFFHCGSDSFLWRWTLEDIQHRVDNAQNDTSEFSAAEFQCKAKELYDVCTKCASKMMPLASFHNRREMGTWPATFVGILEMRGRNTTDRRDYIYGSLGMFENLARTIQVDYNMTYEALCSEATYAFITNMDCLRPLCHTSAMMNGVRSSPRLPTWSLNFETAQNKHLLFPNFSATGAWDDPFSCDYVWPYLKLRGTFFDEVIDCHRITGVETGRFVMLENLRRLMKEWRQFMDLEQPCTGAQAYVGGGSCEDAFRCTIFTDQLTYVKESELASSTFGPFFGYLENPNSRDIDIAELSQYSESELAMNPFRFSLLSDLFRTNTYLFKTRRGYMGLSVGPSDIAIGDHVYLMHRAEVPFILRPVVTDEHEYLFEVASECYVHGIMYGEAFEPAPSLDSQLGLRHQIRHKLFGGTSPDLTLPVAPFCEIWLT